MVRADGATVEYEYGGGTLRHAFDALWEPTGFEGDLHKPLAGKRAAGGRAQRAPRRGRSDSGR